MTNAEVINWFFSLVEDDRREIEKGMEKTRKTIERCQDRPSRARRLLGTYMSSDGRVWLSRNNEIVELRRTLNPLWYVIAFFCGWPFKFAPYARINYVSLKGLETKLGNGGYVSVGDLTFVKRSDDKTEEYADWCWEVPFPGGMFWNCSDLAYYQSLLEARQRYLEYLEAILAQRETITKWMIEDVARRNRHESETIHNGDWPELYERFIPKHLTRRDGPQGTTMTGLCLTLNALAGITDRHYIC